MAVALAHLFVLPLSHAHETVGVPKAINFRAAQEDGQTSAYHLPPTHMVLISHLSSRLLQLPESTAAASAKIDLVGDLCTVITCLGSPLGQHTCSHRHAMARNETTSTQCWSNIHAAYANWGCGLSVHLFCFRAEAPFVRPSSVSFPRMHVWNLILGCPRAEAGRGQSQLPPCWFPLKICLRQMSG
jgi:hypothetical protein